MYFLISDPRFLSSSRQTVKIHIFAKISRRREGRGDPWILFARACASLIPTNYKSNYSDNAQAHNVNGIIPRDNT